MIVSTCTCVLLCPMLLLLSRSVVSDSVRPCRRQPTRLPRRWDSPGKNTGVGCISFSNAWEWKVKVKSFSRPDSSRPQGLQPTRPLRPWDFPGQSTGVGCHCLLRYAPYMRLNQIQISYFVVLWWDCFISQAYYALLSEDTKRLPVSVFVMWMNFDMLI